MKFYKWKEELRDRKVFIWGASIGGKQALGCLTKNGIMVEAYCDNDKQKWRGEYSGKPVISPESLQLQCNAESVVIIASYAYEAIYQQILKLGLKCKIYIYLLYDPCHLKAEETYSEDEKRAIRTLYTSETYTNGLVELILEKGFLNDNCFGDIKEYLGYGGIDQYYYDGIADKIAETEYDITLLDIGAYIGDSISQMKGVFKGKIGKVYAFEPGEENCKEIRKKQIENLTLYEFALGNTNHYVNFSEKGPFFRASGKADGIPTKLCRLDDLNICVNGKSILKIDIEGMEMECLKGAKEFIIKNRPYIAVCVYHKEKDILDIPRYIKSLVPDYYFLLRGGMHTVCYAFPEEGGLKNECNG